MDMTKRLEIERSKANITMLLEHLSRIVIDADADAENISYYLDYNDFDLFNSFMVFNHVWSSYAIHSGAFNMDNAYEKMSQFKRHIEATFGVNTFELTEKVCNKKDYGTDTEKNSSEE